MAVAREAAMRRRGDVPPKIKWRAVRIRTRVITLPKLCVTTDSPIHTINSRKKLSEFRAALRMAMTNKNAMEPAPPPFLLMYR